MAFTKRTYKDNETVITAANLNAIQDELLRVANGFDNGDFDGEPGEDGVGIASIQQTTTSTADSGNNVFTVTLTNGTTARFNVRNGSKGSTGEAGSPSNPGANGNDGIGIASIKQTTTSSVDGGNNVFTVTLTNGATATFTVKNGSKGSAGADGKAGEDGVTPEFSIGTVTTLSAGSSATASITGTAEKPVLNLGIPKGKDGTSGGGTGGTGADGEDGGYYIPAVNSSGDLSWSPTKADMPAVQTVNIKGEKGDTGEKGEKGDKGDPGEKGDKGDTGDAGYTPVRGTDYWTAADIAEIKSYVDEAILGGAW